MGGSDEHIVMLPFMAQGHLIPFLALARKIHQRTGFTITIVNTPLNIQYLRNTTNSASSDSKIRLVELPFSSSDHGLPPNTENTEALLLQDIMKLLEASVSLQAPFYRLLTDIIEDQGKPPLCVIADVLFGWAIPVAKSIDIVGVTFNTCGAYGGAAYFSTWQNLPHVAADSDEYLLPQFPCSHRFNRTHLHRPFRVANGTDKWSRFFQAQFSFSLTSSGWLCNSVQEIELLGVEILRNFTRLPVWTIGPLFPLNPSSSSNPGRVLHQRAGKEPGVSLEKCLQFLDLHPECSVLYISFGSQNTINPTQMLELATGLEESGKPFIWVIRPPIGFDIKSDFRAEWLPGGFEERVSNKGLGLLVHNWAPQLEILSHKSTGAFLSHCGWNSVLESLSQGVPIIGWPMAAEQAFNSKMLMEEMGVCVVLARGVENAILGKEVKRVVELVLDKRGKGEEMKKKALQFGDQIKAAIRDEDAHKGSSIKALDDFLSYILTVEKIRACSDKQK